MEFTRFERTRVISARALQLSFGAPSLTKIKNLAEPYDIAVSEYEKQLLPLTVFRDKEFKRFEPVHALEFAEPETKVKKKEIEPEEKEIKGKTKKTK